MKNKQSALLTKVVGFVSERRQAKMSMSRSVVTVRFTSDRIGETLSLQAGDVQITVPFEPVEELIEATRKSAK